MTIQQKYESKDFMTEIRPFYVIWIHLDFAATVGVLVSKGMPC